MTTPDVAAPPAAAPAPAKPKQRRRWLRWLVIVLALAIVLRLLLAFTLSWLIEVGIGAAGLEGRVGGSSLSLHGGWLRLEHVEIRPPGGFAAKQQAYRENRAPPPDSSIAFDRLEADLDMGALLTGHVRVESLILDELRVVMLRDQQGWLLLEALAGKPDETPSAPHEAKPEPAPKPSTEPPDLRLPVEIVHADIHPFHVRLLDGHDPDSVAPELDGSLLATDVGTEGKTGEWHLLINGPGAVDVVRVDGTLAAQKTALDATLSAELDGLHPDWLARYAAPAMLRATAQRVDGHVSLTAQLADEGRGVAVKAQVSASLSADGHEALALDRCEVALRPAPDGASSGLTVSISGLRGEAGKRVDGSLALAGLEIVPAPASAATHSKPEAAPVAAAPPAAEASAPPPALHVDDVELADAHFAWRDESLGPGAALAVELPRVKLGPRDPAASATTPMPLSLQLRVPGVCEAFTLDGRVVLATEAPAVDLQLHATGLALKALDPWLEPAGWQSELSDQGELGARLAAQAQVAPDGRVTATLQLHDVKLSDGETRLALAGLVCERASFDPANGAVHVVRVDIDGPSVPAHRDAQGVLHVAGLRSVPPRRPVLAEVPEIQGPPPPPLVIEDLAAPSAPSAPAEKPAPLVIGEVLWHGADFSLRDDAVAPPVDFALRPALKVQDLTLGDGAPKGTLVASLDAPAVWERCELGVSLHQAAAPANLGITAKLALGNLNAAGLEGWVRAAGLQLPGLHTDLDGTIDITTGGDRTDVKLDGLTWKDGGATVLSVPSVRVLGIGPAHGGTRIESVEVPDFEFTASRAADGALLLGGARFAPLAAGEAAPAPDPAPSAAPEPEPAARPSTTPAAPAVFVLGALRFGTGKAVVHWHDEAVLPPVDAHLQIGASVDGLLMGARGDPARVALTLVAPQIMDGLKWEGTVQLAPDDMRVEGALAVDGVRLGPLASYLPPGCSSTLKHGRLALKLAADAGAAAAGGQRAALRVTELSWRDADEPPMLALDALAVSATRLDPAAGVAVIDQVALTGLQIQAARLPGGALSLLGFEFGPPPLGPQPLPLVPAAPAPAPATAPPPAAKAAGPTTAAAAPTGTPTATPRPPSSAAPKYSDLRVNSVDFELRGLTLTDQSGAGGAPLVLAATLKSPEPLILADSSREDLQSARLELRASAEPVLRSLAMDVSIDVAAARPNLRVDLKADGLRGSGLTEVLPELAEKLDGSGLSDGSFSAKFLADLSWPRRGPLDFDFGGGLSGELNLTDVALRTQPDADPVLALKRLEVDMADVRPAVGLLHFSSIEMDYPYARATVTPEGFHFAGLLLKAPPPPAEGSAPEAATAEAATPPAPAPPPAVATAPPPSGAPATRLKIDRILASGLDVELRDDTATPPMVLPIADLDVDVHDLSSGITPARPVRFTVSVRGGNVPFPVRKRSDASLTGLVGSTARAIGGSGEKAQEERRIFDELLVQGRLVPGIPPIGWCNVNLSALELQAFAGPALRAGLIIDDGTLDATVRIRMNGPEGSDVDSTLTFTYLALSEPENGPVSRWLHLSAPLDSVLFLLRNADGEHIIPADFHVEPGGLGRGEVQGAATSAIGSVIARALASAPLRLIGSVTDLVGVTGGEGPPPEPPIVLDYAPGDPVLPAGADRAVWELTKKLLDDRDLDLVLQHEFGAGDARVATTLGNPSPEDARRLQERLAARRLERERLRDSKAAESRALLAVGRPVEAREAAQEVIGFDRDIAATEDAQDRVLTLLDPGADRRIAQRTRAAGVEFGQARLDDIRRRIGATGGDEILKRVELRPVRFEPNTARDGGQVTLTLKPHPRSGGFFHWLFGWIPELFRSDPEPPPP